jgi:hypothetical protein
MLIVGLKWGCSGRGLNGAVVSCAVPTEPSLARLRDASEPRVAFEEKFACVQDFGHPVYSGIHLHHRFTKVDEWVAPDIDN